MKGLKEQMELKDKSLEKYLTFNGEHFLGGERMLFKFPNKYGASVVRSRYTYGGGEGLWELAVLKDGEICYDTQITDDVVGWLDLQGVETLLQEIRRIKD